MALLLGYFTVLICAMMCLLTFCEGVQQIVNQDVNIRIVRKKRPTRVNIFTTTVLVAQTRLLKQVGQPLSLKQVGQPLSLKQIQPMIFNAIMPLKTTFQSSTTKKTSISTGVKLLRKQAINLNITKQPWPPKATSKSSKKKTSSKSFSSTRQKVSKKQLSDPKTIIEPMPPITSSKSSTTKTVESSSSTEVKSTGLKSDHMTIIEPMPPITSSKSSTTKTIESSSSTEVKSTGLESDHMTIIEPIPPITSSKSTTTKTIESSSSTEVKSTVLESDPITIIEPMPRVTSSKYTTTMTIKTSRSTAKQRFEPPIIFTEPFLAKKISESSSIKSSTGTSVRPSMLSTIKTIEPTDFPQCDSNQCASVTMTNTHFLVNYHILYNGCCENSDCAWRMRKISSTLFGLRPAFVKKLCLMIDSDLVVLFSTMRLDYVVKWDWAGKVFRLENEFAAIMFKNASFANLVAKDGFRPAKTIK